MHFGCRIFDIRLMADRMSKIWHSIEALRMSDFRHSIGRASDVEYSTFDWWPIECQKYPTFDRTRFGSGFGCRIFDIRLCDRSNRKDPIQQWDESNRIFYIRSDRMHTSNYNMLRVYCKKEKVKNEIFMELLSRASVTTRPHIMGSQVVGALGSE